MKRTALAIAFLLAGGPAFAVTDTMDLPREGTMQVERPATDGGSSPTAVKHQGSISYVSGGVGDEEERQLKAMASQFNLGVTLSTPDGHFLGGARLRVIDSAGKEVLDANTSGPLFYAQLPPGAYRVEAAAAGSEATRKVDVSQGKRSDVVFTFPAPGTERREDHESR
jgi:hypothetical protein